MSSRRSRIKAAPNLAVVRAKARGEAKDQPTTNTRNVFAQKTHRVVVNTQKTEKTVHNRTPPVSSPLKPSGAVTSIAKVDINVSKHETDLASSKVAVKSVEDHTEVTLQESVIDVCKEKDSFACEVDEHTDVLIQETEELNSLSTDKEGKIIEEICQTVTTFQQTTEIDQVDCNVKSLDNEIEETSTVADLSNNENPKIQEDNKVDTVSKDSPTKETVTNKDDTFNSGDDINKVADNNNKVPKLSTGQFVNGKYLPKSKSVSSVNENQNEDKSDSKTNPSTNEKKPALRRFIGYKNRFKPNLFSRSQQMEVELNRGQTQKLASLPDVNNPTRARKHSTSDDTGATKEKTTKENKEEKDKTETEERQVQTRQRKNSVNSDKEDARKTTTRPRRISVGDKSEISTRSRKISCGDKSSKTEAAVVSREEQLENKQIPAVTATRNLEVHNSSVDSPDEIIVTDQRQEVEEEAMVTTVRSTTPKSVLQRSIVLNGNTPLEGGKRRRRSWSGSNSSEDEINRLKTATKPRRRTADSKIIPTDRTNYALKRRKIESKRRFSNGVPGRGKMTMFDLIYYNPDNGTEMRKENEEEGDKEDEERSVVGDRESLPPTPVKEAAETAEVPEPEADCALPVPQVKVGPNGEIIIDESSTMVETTASKRARNDLVDSTLVVENSNKLTNYGTYSKKRKYNDWTERETFRFYRALSIVGSDFSMMESLFKRRTRHELKLKFKKEEKMNGSLVDKCLSQRGQFADLKEFMEEESDEEILEEKVDRPGRGRRKQGGKLSRKGEARGRKVHNRGMYDSSSGGEDADVSETSRSPANRSRHLPATTPDHRRIVQRPNQNPNRTTPCNQVQRQPSADSSGTAAVSLGTATLQKLPGVSFPPALLAANPGLAGAKPGSLVVVASPSKTDPSSQLLHVYMVSDKKKKQLTGTTTSTSQAGTPPRGSRSPTPTRQTGGGGGATDLGRFSIDPAVVRAVDRKRASVDRGAGSGGGGSKLDTDSHVYRRQRTLSEGSMISPSKLRSLSRPALSNSESLESEPYSRTRRPGGGESSGGPGSPSLIFAAQTSSQSVAGSSQPSSQPSGQPLQPLDAGTANNISSSLPHHLPVAKKSKPRAID